MEGMDRIRKIGKPDTTTQETQVDCDSLEIEIERPFLAFLL